MSPAPRVQRPIPREEPMWPEPPPGRTSSPSHPDLSPETRVAMMLIEQVCDRVDAGSERTADAIKAAGERQADAISEQARATTELSRQMATLSSFAPDARRLELEFAEMRGRTARLETQAGDHELRLRPLETAAAKAAVVGLIAGAVISAVVSLLFGALKVHAEPAHTVTTISSATP